MTLALVHLVDDRVGTFIDDDIPWIVACDSLNSYLYYSISVWPNASCAHGNKTIIQSSVSIEFTIHLSIVVLNSLSA